MHNRTCYTNLLGSIRFSQKGNVINIVYRCITLTKSYESFQIENVILHLSTFWLKLFSEFYKCTMCDMWDEMSPTRFKLHFNRLLLSKCMTSFDYTETNVHKKQKKNTNESVRSLFSFIKTTFCQSTWLKSCLSEI